MGFLFCPFYSIGSRWHKASRPITYQISSPGFLQGRQCLLVIFGFGKLQQSTLQAFFSKVRNMDGHQSLRIKSGMVHGRRDGTRCRIEILHLLWHDFVGLDVQGQFNRIIQAGSRMSRNQVWNQKLLFTQLGIDLLILSLEFLVGGGPWLSHRPERFFTDMLRRHFQLAADMVTADLLQESRCLIHQDGIEPDARANKHLLDTLELTHFLQDLQIGAMVCA